MKQKRKGFKENTWMSRPCNSPSSNASELSSSIKTRAQSNLACSWVEDSGSSASSSSLGISSNQQRLSNNKDHQGGCCPNMLTQEMEFIYTGRLSLAGGHGTSLLDPTIISPLGSPSAFTTTSSSLNHFCACSESYEKDTLLDY